MPNIFHYSHIHIANTLVIHIISTYFNSFFVKRRYYSHEKRKEKENLFSFLVLEPQALSERPLRTNNIRF